MEIVKKKYPERELTKQVASFMRLAFNPSQVRWYHIPNGENRNAATGALLKAMGTMAGVPDFHLEWAGGHAYIELKAGKGTLNLNQMLFKQDCEAFGIPHAVCKSLDEVIAFIDQLGLPRRQTKL
jgi:hypothetical protein